MKLKVLVCALAIQFLNATEQNPPSFNTMSLAQIRKQLAQDHVQAMQARQEARNKEAVVALENQEEQDRISLQEAFHLEWKAFQKKEIVENCFILDHEPALNRFFTQDESLWENADVINVHHFYLEKPDTEGGNFLNWVKNHPNKSLFLLNQINIYETYEQSLEITFFDLLILSQSILKDDADLTSWKVNITLISELIANKGIEEGEELGWIYSKLKVYPLKESFFENYYLCASIIDWSKEGRNVLLHELGAAQSLEILNTYPIYIEQFMIGKSKRLAKKMARRLI